MSCSFWWSSGSNTVWACRWIPVSRRNYCVLLQPWRWRQYVSPKRWCLPASPHGVTTHKTNIIFTALENLKSHSVSVILYYVKVQTPDCSGLLPCSSKRPADTRTVADRGRSFTPEAQQNTSLNQYGDRTQRDVTTADDIYHRSQQPRVRHGLDSRPETRYMCGCVWCTSAAWSSVPLHFFTRDSHWFVKDTWRHTMKCRLTKRGYEIIHGR
jgi:hypothetical protein